MCPALFYPAYSTYGLSFRTPILFRRISLSFIIEPNLDGCPVKVVQLGKFFFLKHLEMDICSLYTGPQGPLFAENFVLVFVVAGRLFDRLRRRNFVNRNVSYKEKHV